jgi:hypothetical protein
MTQLASLFVVIVIGMILAFLIFLVEKFKVPQNNPNQCNNYNVDTKLFRCTPKHQFFKKKSEYGK